MNTEFKEMVQSGKFCVLDTETTGLSEEDEICEIAIISSIGEVLIDQRIKPSISIPQAATKIHGITDFHVLWSPHLEQVSSRIYDILVEYHNVVIYNADFDAEFLRRQGVLKNNYSKDVAFWCAMKAFSETQASRRWRTLARAAAELGIKVNDSHNALADCKTTLKLVKEMAGVQ